MVTLTLVDREMPSATERVARLRLELNYMSIRELESKEVVKIDESNYTVREGPKFNDKWNTVFK